MASLSNPPLLVKRYGRTRLYDTAGARYVTTDDLRKWATQGVVFTVLDAETEEDVTQVLLA